MQEEGRERWTLVCIWQESKPTHGVCVCVSVRVCVSVCVLLSVRWLMKWTLGLGNWFWPRRISLSLSLLPSLPAGLLSVFPPVSSILPSWSRFGSSHSFPLAEVEGWFFFFLKCVWWWGTNKLGCLVLSVLYYRTICLLVQVKVLHHLLFFLLVPASQIFRPWEYRQPP